MLCKIILYNKYADTIDMRLFFFTLLFAVASLLPAQTFSSTSSIDWTKPNFSSVITLDIQKAGIPMPSGRSTAVDFMHIQMPRLIKDALLSIPVNSLINLGDLVISETISLDQIATVINAGKSSSGAFLQQSSSMQMTHSISINEISSLLIAHNTVYIPARPLDRVASRSYTGIIIDARGILPVQGEFSSSQAVPCLFPKIWDENMNLLFERNMVEPEIAKEGSLVQYSYSDNINDYVSRIGTDPIYIYARKIYGSNPTDPIISRTDALRILSVPQNINLIKQGKIVILLDKDKLVHAVTAPQKTAAYYALYDEIVQRLYDNKVPNIVITDTYKGVLIALNDIKFVANAPQILPEELPRLERIVNTIKEANLNTKFSILVEGHTARVGEVQNEQALSEARAKTIVEQMIKHGIPADIISYKGYGGTLPVATNNTEEGRAKNRRVQITILPEFNYTVWY